MKKELKTSKDLDNYINGIAKDLCEKMANEVYLAINYYLYKFYSEYSPEFYKRTEDLLRSAFQTKVVRSGKWYEAVVGIDYSSLNDYYISGYDVVSMADKGMHGSDKIVTETHIYSDAIDYLIIGRKIIDSCEDFLKGRGLKIF